MATRRRRSRKTGTSKRGLRVRRYYARIRGRKRYTFARTARQARRFLRWRYRRVVRRVYKD